jgi:hypothetical protein
MNQVVKKLTKSVITLSTCGSFVIVSTLSGCATMSAGMQQSRIGRDDGTDACYPSLRAFDDTHGHWTENIVGGAVAGAALGALAGYALTGSASGAEYGALTGGIAGATAGAQKAATDQAEAKAQVYSQISSRYDSELAQVDASLLAFKQLVDCRNATLRQVVNDYKSKAIDAETAKSRWKHILALKDKDLKIAAAEGNDMQRHIGELEKHSNDQLSGYSNVAWDANMQRQFDMEQAALDARHREEDQQMRAQYEAHKKELARQKDRKAQAELAAKYEQDKQAQQKKQQSEMIALQQKKAGQVPTSSAQTHLQSYNTAVATQQQSYQSQVAVADNPDGFEAAIGPS